MIDEINQKLNHHAQYAINDLRQLGFEVNSPEIAFSTDIPNDRIASYDPKDDTLYVCRDPEDLSEAEYDELMTEMQKQIIRSDAVDDVEVEDLTESYVAADKLEKTARKPLGRIFEVLENELPKTYDQDRSRVEVTPTLEMYKDKLAKGDYGALDRLVDPDKTSILDEELEDIDASKETREDISFYKKVLDEQYDFLTAAIDRKANIEILMRHQLETSKIADEKVEQAASLLIGPLNHGEIDNIRGETKEKFLGNIRTEDTEIEQITQEILTDMRINNGEKSAEARFRDSLDNAREYWSQSSS